MATVEEIKMVLAYLEGKMVKIHNILEKLRDNNLENEGKLKIFEKNCV